MEAAPRSLRLGESRALPSAAEPHPVVATALWAVPAFQTRGGSSVVWIALPWSRADGPQGRGYNRSFESARHSGRKSARKNKKRRSCSTAFLERFAQSSSAA